MFSRFLRSLPVGLLALYSSLAHAEGKDAASDRSQWAQRYFTAAREPVLRQPVKKQPATYRFLWLREVHDPVVVRVTDGTSGPIFRITHLSGNIDGEPGRIRKQTSTQLTPRDWQNFLRLIDKSEYWTMSPADPLTPQAIGGSIWILAASNGTRYHIVERLSPNWLPVSRKRKDRALPGYAIACRYLLHLSKLDVRKDEVF